MIPVWAIYGLSAAFLTALMPLAQERYRAPAYALAVGTKIALVILTLPFLFLTGLPTAPAFYVGTAFSGIVWCVSDVFYYRAAATVGAGPVSRLLAATTVPGFILWFFADPALLATYAAQPWRSAGVIACILAATGLAMRLSRCQVTRQTLKLMWFTALASVIGPTMNKLILTAAGGDGATQAPIALTCLQGGFMLLYWSLYSLYRQNRGRDDVNPLGHPHGLAELRRALSTRPVLIAAALIGLVSAARVTLVNYGIMDVEHPSYIVVLQYTDVLWVILIYRLAGRRETANVAAGLGLAACAALLVWLKTL